MFRFNSYLNACSHIYSKPFVQIEKEVDMVLTSCHLDQSLRHDVTKDENI